MSEQNSFLVFSGTSTRYLAEKICASLGCPLGNLVVTRFSDGEFAVSYEESIRGRDVFLVQSTFPNSDNLMELLKNLFSEGEALTYDQLTEKISAAGLKLANIADGSYVSRDKMDSKVKGLQGQITDLQADLAAQDAQRQQGEGGHQDGGDALHHEITPAIVGTDNGALGSVGHSHGVTPIFNAC